MVVAVREGFVQEPHKPLQWLLGNPRPFRMLAATVLAILFASLIQEFAHTWLG